MRSLDNAAAALLGVAVPKEYQLSDWRAAKLSPGQLAYAAADAVLTRRLWDRISPILDADGLESAYELQRCAIVPVADMKRRGVDERMPLITAPVKFGIGEGFDRNAYEALPEWLRTIVAKSPEYQKAVASETPQGPTDERPKAYLGKKRQQPAAAAGKADRKLDDEIPFATSDPAVEPIPVLSKRIVA
jgi:hypothetical protein